MPNLKRGFTLIELLVVIAIIGILSGTVLVGLNSARTLAKEARMKADLRNMKTVIEMGFNGSTYPDLVAKTYSYSNTWVGALSSSSDSGGPGPNYEALKTLDADMVKQNPIQAVFYRITTDNGLWSPAKTWAIYGQLISSSTQFSCVDSTGVAAITPQSSLSFCRTY